MKYLLLFSPIALGHRLLIECYIGVGHLYIFLKLFCSVGLSLVSAGFPFSVVDVLNAGLVCGSHIVHEGSNAYRERG